MQLYAFKVLIQWLPTSFLRVTRAAELGGKWGTEGQQHAVPIHSPHFPLAMALAEQRDDGRYLLQIGFRGTLRHNEVGWIFDGKPEIITYRFDDMPEEEERRTKVLLKQARKEFLANGGRVEVLRAAVARYGKLRSQLLRKAAEATEATAAEGRKHSPMLNPEAFDAVAGWAIRYEDGKLETLGPAEGHAAVTAMREAVAKAEAEAEAAAARGETVNADEKQVLSTDTGSDRPILEVVVGVVEGSGEERA